MIVRILHEGQYRIKGADLDVINDLDNELVSCVAAGNDEKFTSLLEQMLDLVRQHGKPVDVDEFVESDVILPASGSTMDEVQHMFAGEGLIPWMTPFDLALGDHGPTLLLGAIALAAALTLLTALLEVALARAGGPDPAALPDPLAEHGPKLVVLGGMPALVLAVIAAAGMTLILGGRPNAEDLQAARPLGLALFLGWIVAAVCLGFGPPLGEHWGAAVTGFAAGVGLLFPILLVINRLPFAEDGSIAYPDRAVFALMVALLLAAIVLIAASLIGLGVSAWRVFREVWAARRVRWPEPAPASRPSAPGSGAQRAR